MDDNFVKVSGMKSLAVNSLLNDMYMEYYICIICMYTVIYVYVCIHYIHIIRRISCIKNHVSHSVFYNISCIVDYTCYRSYSLHWLLYITCHIIDYHSISYRIISEQIRSDYIISDHMNHIISDHIIQ